MKGVRAEYPYDDYYLYIVFHKGEGRYYANLISIKYGRSVRKTISYARYLMSVKERRILSEDEQVDHIDGNKANDDISNLQILSSRANRYKEMCDHGRKMVELKCPNCGKLFIREKRRIYCLNSGISKSVCCSRHCAGQFQFEVAKNTEKAIIGIKENIVREFETTAPIYFLNI